MTVAAALCTATDGNSSAISAKGKITAGTAATAKSCVSLALVMQPMYIQVQEVGYVYINLHAMPRQVSLATWLSLAFRNRIGHA